MINVGKGGPADSTGVGTSGATFAAIGVQPVSAGDRIFVLGSCYAENPNTLLAVILELQIKKSTGWVTARTAVTNLLVTGPNSATMAVFDLLVPTSDDSWEYRLRGRTTIGTVDFRNAELMFMQY